MLAYALRRLLVSIPVLIVSTFVVFLLVSYSGDPLSSLKTRQPPAPQATIKLYEHKLRLDQPVLERYWHWITGVLHGNFGPSVQSGFTVNVGDELRRSLFVSLRLIILAMIVAAIIAVIVGVVSAMRQYTATDYAFTFTGFLFLSMPVFWFAILLKQGAIWLNQHAGTNIQTLFESGTNVAAGFWPHFTDSLNHLLLPTLTLALTSYAAWSRFNRASMLEVLNSDYIRLARAKGLSRRRVLIRHALRTALIPFVTVTALDVASILGATVITEFVFQWRGLGTMLLDGIEYKDIYVVMAWLLVAAVIVIVFNLIADLLYGVLDPRIRYE